ncbi:hypothetical protein [Levilactobacillus cerevisiae]|uniref:hypothetical protein n=1 Tax=Levilactobacillus cerevisiae TaxID=1704076 RepID=UPI0013DE563C|nr:hypothetical protein [Levilactobacillus cerevisiae]
MKKRTVSIIIAVTIMTIFSVFESNFQTRIIGILISITILLALIYFELASANTNTKK